MSQKDYSEAPELKLVSEKLKDRYFLYLGHVDLDSIFFAEIDGEKPKKAAVAVMSGVSTAWVRQLLAQQGGKVYCFAVWADEWTELSPSQQEWIIFDCLYSITPENDGKLRKPDVQEHGIICEYLGPYWRKKLGTGQELPGLLSSADPLPIPPPPLNEDIGSTLAGEMGL